MFSFVLMTIESSGFMSLLSSSTAQITCMMGSLLILSLVQYTEAILVSTDQSLSSGAGVLLTSGVEADCAVFSVCYCAVCLIGTGLLVTLAV